jgi:glycosyltransferase involved in cell wall biosynthesis
MVTFSVLIATAGRAERLARALAAVGRLTPAPLEIVVIDGDADRSAEPVTAAAAAHLPYPVVHVPAERGLTRQRNRGLDVARGDVVVFLDDDAEPAVDVLGVLAEVYADPAVVGATGRVNEPSSHRVGGQRSVLRRVWHGGRREGTFTASGYPRRLTSVDRPRDVELMPGCFMSARTDAARQVRFDEQLPGYALAEDEDFSYRLARVGRIRFDPRATVEHDNSGFDARDRRAFGRTVVVNRHYLFRKNFAQTRTARLRFAGLVAAFVLHRLVNGDLAGARGVLDGARDVARGALPGEPSHG